MLSATDRHDSNQAGADDIYRVASGLRAISIWYSALMAVLIAHSVLEHFFGEFSSDHPVHYIWSGTLALTMVVVGYHAYWMAGVLYSRGAWLVGILAGLCQPFAILPLALLWVRGRQYLRAHGVEVGLPGPDRATVEALRQASGQAEADEEDLFNAGAGLRTLTLWFPVFVALLIVNRLYFSPVGDFTDDHVAKYMMLIFFIAVSGIVVFDSVLRVSVAVGMRLPVLWALGAVFTPLVNAIIVGWLWMVARRFLPKHGIAVGILGPPRATVRRLREERDRARLLSERRKLDAGTEGSWPRRSG